MHSAIYQLMDNLQYRSKVFGTQTETLTYTNTNVTIKAEDGVLHVIFLNKEFASTNIEKLIEKLDWHINQTK